MAADARPAKPSQGPQAYQYLLREDGVLRAASYEETVAALTAKEQALHEEVDRLKLEVQRRVKARDLGEVMELVRNMRATDHHRLALESQLQEITGHVGAAMAPGKGGIGRSAATSSIEDCSAAIRCSDTPVDPAALFEEAVRAIEAGGTVAFLDDSDDLASRIAAGATGLPGWELARALCFRLDASATVIREHMETPAFARAERVRQHAACFGGDAALERNRAEVFAGMMQGSYGSYGFTTAMESLLSASHFQEAWGRRLVNPQFLDECARSDEEVCGPQLYLWYLEAGGQLHSQQASKGGRGRGKEARDRLKQRLNQRERALRNLGASMTAVLRAFLSATGGDAVATSWRDQVQLAGMKVFMPEVPAHQVLLQVMSFRLNGAITGRRMGDCSTLTAAEVEELVDATLHPVVKFLAGHSEAVTAPFSWHGALPKPGGGAAADAKGA